MSKAKIIGGISTATGVLVLSGIGYYYFETTKKTSQLTEMAPAVVTTNSAVSNENNPAIRLWVDLVPGKTWKSQTNIESSSTVQGAIIPEPIEQQTTIRIHSTHRILPPNEEGQTQIDNLIDDAQMTVVVNGEEVDLKSKGVDVIGSMIGTNTIDVVDSFGRIMSEVKDEQQNDTFMSNPALLALGNIDRIALCELPEKPVRIGDTWTRTITVPEIPSLNILYECKFERIEDTPQGRVAVITRYANSDLQNLNAPMGKLPMEEIDGDADFTFLAMKGETHHISRLALDQGQWIDHVSTTTSDVKTRMDFAFQEKPISIEMTTLGNEKRVTTMNYGAE